MHTPDEIRKFLADCSPGENVCVEVRSGVERCGRLVSFDGHSLALDIGTVTLHISIDAIRRVLIDVSHEARAA